MVPPALAHVRGRVRSTGRRPYAWWGEGRTFQAPDGKSGGAVASGDRPAMSGPKGFALVICGMLGVLLLLWGLAALVAP